LPFRGREKVLSLRRHGRGASNARSFKWRLKKRGEKCNFFFSESKKEKDQPRLSPVETREKKASLCLRGGKGEKVTLLLSEEFFP